ncbi:extended egl-27 and mta1 homology domain containing protein [Babesia gibsoni]|uniref:Extended egl-27 and mta1 homology domain containing protein n=1 Tax=Babesia gibsoni TaxID=33632 RepID=A0AAD8PER5_BABGI|nr:extended egl-27 and mta1 homology domain containing protein [Babesia gibsoni]
MEDAIYGVDHILSNEESRDNGGYLNGGSDLPDGESVSSLGVDDTDNGSSLNESVSVKNGSIVSEDTAVDGVAVFEEQGEAEGSIKAADCCAECGISKGPLLSCRGCGLLYHSKCLMQCFLPAGEDVWRCPQCQWKMITAGQAPLDNSVNHGDISDDSHSGYDAPVSSIGSDTAPEESFGREKDRDSKSGNSPSSSPTRQSPVDHAEKKRKKPVTEGSNIQTKINVGYGHQVPFTPAFFLDDSYNEQQDRHDWARLMYSPYHLEKIRTRRLQDGSSEGVIKDEFELAEYIQLCAQSWKSNPGWHPFSPEFAYKILHFADYDPKKALKVMNDPNFNFVCVCDPPTRRYENKWKPKDRRGQVATSPYPPPVTLRGYLLRRHDASR